MDRLLSEQEICKLICDDHPCIEPEDECNEFEIVKISAKAQLSKTDKEWMEWLGENIIEFALNFNRTKAFQETLLRVWQERKKEIGL